jgi:hypothetical protein
MTDPISQLIAELGQRLGFPDLALDENDSVVLQLDEFVVSIDANEEENTLTFHSQITIIPEAERAVVALELVDANLFWASTAGSTLSMDASTGAVFCAVRLQFEALNLEKLERHLAQFTDIVEEWTERLSDVEPAPRSAEIPHLRA